MKLSYQRVMSSPYLDDKIRNLTQIYLNPQALEQALKDLVEFIHTHQDQCLNLCIQLHQLGQSTFGAPLLAWTMGDPYLPRMICASQHHGPENYGASFSLYFSYLLTKDPLFQPLLKRFSFSFLPQQNPDAILMRGNGQWMKEPNLKNFIQHYQYDPRHFDVEHGIPPIYLNGKDRPTFRRVESETLAYWIEQECQQYGAPIYYQSGHAWSILDAPLYLIYPNQSQTSTASTWAKYIQNLNLDAPYHAVASEPPFTDDYDLPQWLSQHSEGFYILPTRNAFLKSNPDSQVQCSSMDVVAKHAPQARILVIEPPIFSCDQIKEGYSKTPTTIQQLVEAATLHQSAVNRCHDLWQSKLESQLGSLSVDEAYFHQDHTIRLLAQLRLETLERQGTQARWNRLAESLTQQKNSKKQLPTRLLHLAVIDQYFSASNYISLALKLIDDPELHDLFQQSLQVLSQCQLTPWKVEWGVFVYLCPILATTFSELSSVEDFDKL